MSTKALIGLSFLVLTGACEERLDELKSLKVAGKVDNNAFISLGGVRVRAYCGSQSTETLTNGDGSYELDASIKDCSPLVVEFSKEAYLPAARTLPLPPPTSEVTIDVSMPELTELLCDESSCVEENNNISAFDSDPVFHGWVISMMGEDALEFVGGEFRTTDGDIVWSVGFGHFDFRDRAGARLEQFAPYTQCTKVPPEALDWLVDVQHGNGTIDLNLFHLKSTAGRWTERDTFAVINATVARDPQGRPIIEEVPEDKLDTVRANKLKDSMGQSVDIWACMPIDGSGWYMWGSSLEQTACFNLAVSDNCSATGSANTFFTLQGRDLGFYARTSTNRDGKACLEVAASEPVGTDYDLDGLGGETFFLDGEASADHGSTTMPALESPRKPGSCDQPSSCGQLSAKFQVACDPTRP